MYWYGITFLVVSWACTELMLTMATPGGMWEYAVFAEEEHETYVPCYDPIPLRFRKVYDRGEGYHGGIIDEDVDFAQAIASHLNGRLYLSRVGDVGSGKECLSACPGDYPYGRLARSTFRSTTTTCAPSAANRSHPARPIPDPPPVTKQILPENRISASLLENSSQGNT